MQTRPLALVTGASSGIGAAFARQLARRGCDLALVARRLGRLETLAEELRADHGATAWPISADLSLVDAHEPVLKRLAEIGRPVDILVNNAGYSIPQTYIGVDWPAQRDFVMTLVMAVCGLTHALLPSMIERRSGAIILVGSMAGFSPGGRGHTLYPAAKSFVWKFAQSLDAEWRGAGIRVTCVTPGFTQSEFAQANGTEELMKQSPRSFVMTAEEVVAATLRANDRGAVLCIPGWHNKLAAGLMKYLPDGLVAAIVRRAAEKYELKE